MLLRNARAQYINDFFPFEFEPAVIAELLARAVRDQYWSILFDGVLVGFFMLRGFDEGYARPSFGVFVTEPQAGKGFARAALDHALAWARANEVARVMLKVVHKNLRARAIYERAGFQSIGICPHSGQLMLEIVLAPGAAA